MLSDTGFSEPIVKNTFSYPVDYLNPWTMKNGAEVCIRPIQPDDEVKMVQFHGSLSERTVYLRYLYYMKLDKRTSHERLARICSIDPQVEMVIVAETIQPTYRLAKILEKKTDGKIIAVGRLNRINQTNDAEIAALVADSHQGLGLGTELLNRLLHIGDEAKLDHIIAEILPENAVMKRINEKLDFPVNHIFEDGLLKAVFRLGDANNNNS